MPPALSVPRPRGCSSAAPDLGEPQRRALDPSEPLARAVWDVLERIAAAGAPERFSDALGDAAPAISAFAEDVLAHYRAELDEEGRGMSGFEGRPVLITGGGTGMGRAFALALAERGAPVAVCGRRAEPIEETAELCRAHGAARSPRRSTCATPSASEAWVGEAAAALGPPRMLINNAAGNFLAHAIDLSPNGWRAVIDIVLNGTFYCSTAVARSMREAGVGGSILNVIASYAWTGNPMTAHSAAAKAGVWNLARSLAVEWAPLGIRVNCIAPGPLDSEGAAERLFPTDEIRERMLADIPDRRFTTLEDVVASALFLLSDDAGHITGETLTVDGGQALSQGMFRHSPIPQRP